MPNSEERSYEWVKDWGELPDGWRWGLVAAVSVDSHDRVHVFTRTEHPYMVFDRGGSLLYSWGQGIFQDAHGISIVPHDNENMYFADRNAHQVLKFTLEGRHLLTLGTRGKASDTGYHKFGDKVIRAAEPFNSPTNVAVSRRTGEIYVADGYGNARVHKFSPDGELLLSWGEPGNGPGRFNLVHDVWEHKDRLYVCDRENNHIQIFDPDGSHLDTWTGFGRPGKIFIDDDDVLYLAEVNWRLTVMDLKQNILWRSPDKRSEEPGKFYAPHGIWVDSAGDIYVAEVNKGARLQKYARTR